MKKSFSLLVFTALIAFNAQSQNKLDEILPVRGICMSAPTSEGLDQFIDFINDALVPRKINTIVLRVHYGYQYSSHPELVDDNALSKKEVRKIVKACKEGGIKIIPQVNLLGHQSSYSRPWKLLEQYPQFNETPYVPVNEDIEWPNEWGLYSFSYCPLHPEVHDVVFDIMDEIVEVFEADAFHAGMDEVFYLGDDKCPRCQGRDKAELFAGEVTAIRNHLAQKGKALWIWGVVLPVSTQSEHLNNTQKKGIIYDNNG